MMGVPMITRVEALAYRCLEFVQRPMGAFHVLVGPNASGKTTFLDVLAFLGDVVSSGPDVAIANRARDVRDLIWGRNPGKFQLAVEARIPDAIRDRFEDTRWTTVRYELVCGVLDNGEFGIDQEAVLLKPDAEERSQERLQFPEGRPAPETLMTPKNAKQGARRVASKIPGGNDNFYSESHRESGKGWFPSIRLGPRKSTLGNLPADESKFPASLWLQGLLRDGVQSLALNSLLIRKASPPGQPRGFRPDGSNLPWVIAELEKKSPDRFRQWVEHLATALPDIEGIRTVEREDDHHRYLVIKYRGGLEVPSWVASDGTLRLLALTIPAYISDLQGIYLVEEPENGIHPSAVETVFQSLSSVYDAQVLIATHSPVILSLATLDSIMCFAKTPGGATDIVVGREHPSLRNWKGEVGIQDLFASGVLG